MCEIERKQYKEWLCRLVEKISDVDALKRIYKLAEHLYLKERN